MTSIGGLTAIIHRLRARRTFGQNKTVGKIALQLRQPARSSEREMRPMLAARLAALDLTNPAMQEHAVDIFIETALYREFGTSLPQKESLQDLLVQVRQALICTPDGRKAVLEMLQAVRQSPKQ
jgi:hypothetical protein